MASGDTGSAAATLLRGSIHVSGCIVAHAGGFGRHALSAHIFTRTSCFSPRRARHSDIRQAPQNLAFEES